MIEHGCGVDGQIQQGQSQTDNPLREDGLAAAHGLKTNEIPGRLQIYVTASYRGLRARALINQTVQAPPGAKIPPPSVHTSRSGGGWKWVVLGLAAAGGAGAGIYLANRNSSTTAAASGISVSAGTVVFGSPR